VKLVHADSEIDDRESRIGNAFNSIISSFFSRLYEMNLLLFYVCRTILRLPKYCATSCLGGGCGVTRHPPPSACTALPYAWGSRHPSPFNSPSLLRNSSRTRMGAPHPQTPTQFTPVHAQPSRTRGGASNPPFTSYVYLHNFRRVVQIDYLPFS